MKKILLIAISALCLFFLTGCYDKTEINEAAYVIAMGIDKSKTNPGNIEVTFEFANPIAIESDDANFDKLSTVTTIDAPSIYSAISLVNSYISKQLNLSHNKIVVFSEEIAFEDIEEYTTTIFNDRNFRTNMYILISKCSAQNYINNTKPGLEKNISKFYELLLTSYPYTGFTANSYLFGFILASQSTYREPVALLSNISNTTHSQQIHQQSYKPNDATVTAGEINKKGGPETETIGLAVFRNCKMIGELTGEETIYYLMTNNSFTQSHYSIYDPMSSDNIISFNLVKDKNTKIKVDFVDSVPLINIDISLKANIISVNNEVDYINEENSKEIERELSFILESNIKDYLYKTSKVFNSDISGFGRSAVKNFLTWDEWEKVNWSQNYRYSCFNVNVKTSIDKTGLVLIQQK